MKKSEQTQRSILDIIERNSQLSSTQIAEILGISRISVYTHCRDMIKNGVLTQIGRGKATMYLVQTKKMLAFDPKIIERESEKMLAEMFDTLPKSIAKETEKYFSILMPDGTWKNGFAGVYEHLAREQKGKIISQDNLIMGVVDFLSTYWEQEAKRRKNGFFDGTESLKYTMKNYHISCAIDQLYFCELASISRFGRLRTATEMSIGKIKSHALLLRGTIEPHEKIIHAFLEKHTPDAIVYTPPTVARHVQFRDILKSVIEKNNNTQYISAEKVTDPSRVFQPQKELRGQARITNADASIMVTGAKNLKKMKRIVIFDDNFTTGATMNAIALKIRSQGFYGTITAITICGNFTYIPGETDAGDV